MRYFIIMCFLAVMAASAPAHAQVGQPAAAPKTAVSNEDFRRLALIAQSFDYESSRLALTRAARPSIKRYAASLMGNFRFDYARLSSGAGAFSGIPSLPADPNAAPAPFSDARRAAMLNQLAAATGRDFERLYLDMQSGTRQEILGLYEAYATTGGDAWLLAYARERLPLLKQQFQTISRLAR